MATDSLIAEHGWLAIAIGCFLEGETMLVVGGIAAQQGAISLSSVMVAGFVGGITGDQLWFHVSRHYGPRLLERRPRLQRLAARAERFAFASRDLFIVAFRFLYGLRIAAPLVLGLTSVTTRRYTLLNLAGCVLWCVSVPTLAWYGCASLSTVTGGPVLAAVAVLGFFALVSLLRFRANRATELPDDVDLRATTTPSERSAKAQ